MVCFSENYFSKWFDFTCSLTRYGDLIRSSVYKVLNEDRVSEKSPTHTVGTAEFGLKIGRRIWPN